MSLQTRKLGQTGLVISAIGFGGWAIGGGDWAYGWGSQDDEQSMRTIRRALEFGINWIDTAAVYGLGHSENLISRVLADTDDQPFLFTKCSRVWDVDGNIRGSLSRESIRHEVLDSLRRLGVEQIDLYQIHQPQPEEEIEEGWQTLAELKSGGLVRYIGVSNFGIDQLRRIQRIAPIDTLQVNYSLINRTAEEEILPFCASEGIGVLAYAPMASGLLSGAMTRERVAGLPKDDWRRGDVEYSRGRPSPMAAQFQEPQLSRNLALVETMRDLGMRLGRTPGQIAIAWVLRNPAVSGTIVGYRHPQQVDEILAVPDFALADNHAAELEASLRDS